MPFDVTAEIEKLKANNADNLAKAEVLDQLLVQNRPFDEFKQFVDAFPRDTIHIFEKLVFMDRLFSAEMMTAYENRHLAAIYEMLSGQNYYLALRGAAQIVMEPRIPAARRALFWHIIRSARYPYCGLPGWFYTRRIFADNPSARECWYRYAADALGREFIKNTSGNFSDKRVSPSLAVAVQADSVPILEMNRTLAGRGIGLSLLLLMLRKNAVQCFTHMLTHYPKRVFKLRSPEEWLFTVCRCAGEKLAIAAVGEIERQFPGIVASARDPWGNTLLWNTLANKNSTRRLQAELIRLGCDPNAENEWGLSYQLVTNNTAEKYKYKPAGDEE